MHHTKNGVPQKEKINFKTVTKVLKLKERTDSPYHGDTKPGKEREEIYCGIEKGSGLRLT